MSGTRKISERSKTKVRNEYKKREKSLAERYKLRRILRFTGIALTAAALGAAWYLYGVFAPVILYALIYGNSLQLKNQ